MAVCVSEMLALRPLLMMMPPDELTVLGAPRSSIQRAASSMWMQRSPTMPLPYSMNERQPRGCFMRL